MTITTILAIALKPLIAAVACFFVYQIRDCIMFFVRGEKLRKLLLTEIFARPNTETTES